jgi:hypothetical protein
MSNVPIPNLHTAFLLADVVYAVPRIMMPLQHIGHVVIVI